MKLDIELMGETYNKCVDKLDPSKDCFSCEWETYDKDSKPCHSCYNELLGFHINPTKWKSKEV